MAALETLLSEAVAKDTLPFAVAMVGDSEGIEWSCCAGDAAKGQPAREDSVFRIFSMTKAIGSLAAMILIDRDKLDFDTPVAEILPEFDRLKVIDRFDGDTAILRDPVRPATVRHLATHTSGLEYEIWNADMPRYMEATGLPSILSGSREGLFYPLMSDPGTRWAYGNGIDWLGQVVEAVDGRSIDRFCREEVFEPLAMTSTGFEPGQTKQDRLVDSTIRGGDGSFEPFEIAPPPNPEFYGMGHALYATAPDYLRFLRMLLNGGTLDGQTILSRHGVERMLANHIGDLSLEKMVTVAPAVSADVDIFPGTRKTHSFGFMRVEEDLPGQRSAGSQGWAGVLNTHYWFDPHQDLAAVLMTQFLPFADPRFMQLYSDFETAVYATYRSS
ncbi:serine hydrolase domain-containing protein [Algihabitans albus]|uniref:serine hydrolase domain-containing protein n=1 Tax=Algihabitans albus TaxID=2164067 RepID=UPI0013C34135|nr:serine hydrolase domain-containing protein [Algihabitans albus]